MARLKEGPPLLGRERDDPSTVKGVTLTFGDSPNNEGPGYVVLHCKSCGKDIARSSYSPFSWAHLDDEVIVSAGKLHITKSWDHEPIPDVIDVGEAPSQTTRTPSKRSPHPFY